MKVVLVGDDESAIIFHLVGIDSIIATEDKDLFEKVSSLATKVYGIQRGALSLAVEEGLQYWLQLHTQPLTRVNPRPTTREVYEKVMNRVEFIMGFKPIKVTRTVLEQAIMQVRKIRDPRSIQNWINIFCSEGLMKPLDAKDPRKAQIFEPISKW